MQLVGSLYLLYFPYCGLILWEACSAGNQHRLHAHPRLASLASLLLACSPPINGLLYGLKSQTLRRSVQNYWRKKATKSELQQVVAMFQSSVRFSFSSRLVHYHFTFACMDLCPYFRKYRRERQAWRARDDLPAAGTSPSFPFRPCSGDSARRCWLSARAGPEVVSKAIISDSSAADCNPPSRATLSECRPPNQVHKVIRFACRYRAVLFALSLRRNRAISNRLSN